MADIQITLAAARVNAGLTQEEAAKRLGVSKQTIVNWEKGKTEPRTGQAKEIENIYGIPYNSILFLPIKSNYI